MQNEILLAASLVFIFGGVLVMYRIFGKAGLYCATVIATITANIEVLLLVEAYGMEQTLGNVLFAATFLVTDILSENYSKEDAQKAVNLVVYAICQRFDVWAYHKWWAFTKNRFGDAKSFLWLRNNGSTMISQLMNTVLYSFGAFWGLYDIPTLISICISSYVIFIVTSLADTPAVYLARRMKAKMPEEK